MTTNSRGKGKRVVPIVLGLAMLAVVLAAALTPNAGIVQAQSNGGYPPTTSSTISPYVYLGIAAIVVVAAVLAAALLMRRRRRPPPAAAPPPMQPWEEGGPPAPPAAGGPPAPGAAPAYLETPQDVGRAPPAVPVSKAGPAAGAGAAAGAAAGEGEPDIDSLMAELDKISGEILKKGPKKGAAQKPPEETEEEEST